VQREGPERVDPVHDLLISSAILLCDRADTANVTWRNKEKTPLATRGNAQEERAATVAELRNAVDTIVSAVETILSGVNLRLNRVETRWDERFTELRESVLAMRERAAADRDHYDDMFNAVHRRFDRVEVRLDEIDRRRPRIGFGGGEAGKPT